MKLDDSRTNRLAFAGVSTLTVFAWYALPDVVSSRGVRTAVKTGLLGVTAAGSAVIPQVFPETRHLMGEPHVDVSGPALAAVAVGVTAAAVAGTVWAEKAIYAFGERRRARGVRWAHTPLAAALAVLTGAAALADWSRLAERLSTT